jgi:8-amino-7-oxononanoate synthase
MDGDCPNLEELVRISDEHHCRLVVDEAHALGFLAQKAKDSFKCWFARPYFCPYLTFENGLGCPEAILGSVELRDCLVNFAQSFKYTTGLSFRRDFDWISTFRKRTTNHSATSQKHHSFQSEKNMLGLKQLFVHSKSAIQSAIIPGNENVTSIAQNFKKKDLM